MGYAHVLWETAVYDSSHAPVGKGIHAIHVLSTVYLLSPLLSLKVAELFWRKMIISRP